jgi:lipoprotein-releasing system permease protein
MSQNLRIAFRFLTAKRRAMAMSLACIILGVGLFVVTQATTSGFEAFFIKTILGTNGAIMIQDRIQATLTSMALAKEEAGSEFSLQRVEGRKFISGIEEPNLLIDGLRRFENVRGISPVLSGPVIIHSASGTDNVRVYGVHIDEHLKVSDLGSQITLGDLSDFRSAAAGSLVGSEMARRLGMSIGDSFVLQTEGQRRRYRVSAIYETGVSDIDRMRVYLHMQEARSLLKKTTGATYIQVNLSDASRAPQDAQRMQDVLGYAARPWQEREKTWLEVFRALRLSSAITVSVFTLIAGLAMFNTLAMIVMEKTKEIAILRSMGYTRQDISRIFLWQAIIVLAIGTVIGCLLGATITYAVSRTPIRIRGIFATDTFIVAWSAWHYITAVVTATFMVMIASLIPARRAAQLEPGDVIRGTAQ